MNKDRFHNKLALCLGKDVILDSRFTFDIADSRSPSDTDSPLISIQVKEIPMAISIPVSDASIGNFLDGLSAEQKEEIFSLGIEKELKIIVNAVQQAYKNTKNYSF